MEYIEVLRKAPFLPDLKSESKQGIIEELLDSLISTGLVKNRDVTLKAILERENKMSTGMQNGIAIPHGKTDDVKGVVAAIGISKKPVDFASFDGQPTNLFIMTLSETSQAGPHIQFLSEISKVLTDEDARTKLLKAKSSEEAAAILGNG